MGCCTTNENIHFIHRSSASAQASKSALPSFYAFLGPPDSRVPLNDEVWWPQHGGGGRGWARRQRDTGAAPTFSDGASPSRLGEAVALPHRAAEADVHEALRGRRQRRAAAQQDADLAAQQHPHLAEDKAETRREKDTLVLKNKATECLALDLNWNFPLSSNMLLWHPS